MVRSFVWILLWFSALISAPLRAEEPSLFAMDTIARGGPDVVPLLKELGYAVSAAQQAMSARPKHQKKRGSSSLMAIKQCRSSRIVRRWMTSYGKHLMRCRATTRPCGWRFKKSAGGAKNFDKSSSAADDIALAKLREFTDYAEQRQVKIALYPHTGFWLERVGRCDPSSG